MAGAELGRLGVRRYKPKSGRHGARQLPSNTLTHGRPGYSEDVLPTGSPAGYARQAYLQASSAGRPLTARCVRLAKRATHLYAGAVSVNDVIMFSAFAPIARLLLGATPIVVQSDTLRSPRPLSIPPAADTYAPR